MLAAIKDDPVLDHVSRALGCVRILREDVREGSFGDRWEWSLLMVTTDGHREWTPSGINMINSKLWISEQKPSSNEMF
ncbi:hypothetical protein I5L59_10770 [Pseudomonas moraviensis]|uniref:hypothetical protein n=1 Tax=Pseudomonas moraviensis TaxID=321662 RepID=UPI0018D81EE4|nr:hypothetical protein [Pseudomonas moraviensis]MBH3444057.1 hypothetical protein [Pseudomonas moraviensis]